MRDLPRLYPWWLLWVIPLAIIVALLVHKTGSHYAWLERPDRVAHCLPGALDTFIPRRPRAPQFTRVICYRSGLDHAP